MLQHHALDQSSDIGVAAKGMARYADGQVTRPLMTPAGVALMNMLCTKLELPDVPADILRRDTCKVDVLLPAFDTPLCSSNKTISDRHETCVWCLQCAASCMRLCRAYTGIHAITFEGSRQSSGASSAYLTTARTMFSRCSTARSPSMCALTCLSNSRSKYKWHGQPSLISS